jgi:hypothetical protein
VRAGRAAQVVAPAPGPLALSPGGGVRSRLAASRWLLAELGVVVVLTLLARVAIGSGFAGYDSMWALVWGRQLADGQMPSFDVPAAPTPHPLLNLVAVVLAPLPAGAAVGALVILSWGSLAALAWGTLRLGETLFGRVVGLVAAALVVSRSMIPTLTAQSFVDLPFLALVVWAAALEARRPRSSRAVPVLLLLAGLLRPEAWPIAVVYGCWVLPALDGRERVRMAVLLAAAPVLWALSDLIVTGDPLFSLHGTRALGEELERPTGLGTALETAPDRLVTAVQGSAARVGLGGIVVAILFARRRAALPLALLAVGVGAYLALGLAGLPLLPRYLLIPSVMVSVFAAVAAVGWVARPRDDAVRRRWRALGAVGIVLLILGVPGDLRELDEARAFLQPQRDERADLAAAVRTGEVRGAVSGCRRIRVAPFWRAHLLLHFRGSKSLATVGDFRGGPSTLTFFYAGGTWSASKRSDVIHPRNVYVGPHWAVVADRC